MPNPRQLILPAALATAALAGAVGASALGPTIANAATTATASPSASPTDAPDQRDQSRGGHMANGITETLLTGDTAAKVTAAAQAAVPGATVNRVENDAEGATYEAHMTKSDGTRVTVKLDANFKVTGTETGFGRHRGNAAPTGTNTN